LPRSLGDHGKNWAVKKGHQDLYLSSPRPGDRGDGTRSLGCTGRVDGEIDTKIHPKSEGAEVLDAKTDGEPA